MTRPATLMFVPAVDASRSLLTPPPACTSSSGAGASTPTSGTPRALTSRSASKSSHFLHHTLLPSPFLLLILFYSLLSTKSPPLRPVVYTSSECSSFSKTKKSNEQSFRKLYKFFTPTLFSFYSKIKSIPSFSFAIHTSLLLLHWYLRGNSSSVCMSPLEKAGAIVSRLVYNAS